MKIDTLKDIIHWTQQFHQHLSERMSQSAIESGDERTQLLLGYLAEHEQLLSDKLAIFESSGDLSSLNTWCYEFIDENPMLGHDSDTSLADLSVDEITRQVVEQHQHIIELYQHLLSRAETDSSKACLEQLLSIEEHEIMSVVQAVNRLHDA